MKRFERQLLQLPSQLDPRFKDEYESTVQMVLRSGISSRTALVTMLTNPQASPELLEAICWVMGRQSNSRGFRTAIKRTLKHKQPHVRIAAAMSLGLLSAKSAVPTLLTLAIKDTEQIVRKAAIHALGEIDDRRAISILGQLLLDKREDVSVRCSAAESLGYLQNPNSLDQLLTALNAAEPEVRYSAAFALAWLGDTKALPYLKNQLAVETAEIPIWGSVKKRIARTIKDISTNK
jgi:HEAT repeat protein